MHVAHDPLQIEVCQYEQLRIRLKLDNIATRYLKPAKTTRFDNIMSIEGCINVAQFDCPWNYSLYSRADGPISCHIKLRLADKFRHGIVRRTVNLVRQSTTLKTLVSLFPSLAASFKLYTPN
jgi:hypothetical protein